MDVETGGSHSPSALWLLKYSKHFRHDLTITFRVHDQEAATLSSEVVNDWVHTDNAVTLSHFVVVAAVQALP